MIKIENLTKRYDNVYCALNNLSLNFADKGLVCISGKSGSGKSTLLNCMYGNLNFDGDIYYDNISVKDENFLNIRKNIVSIVYQDFKLLENFTVAENLKIAIENVGIAVTNNYLIELLNKVGIEQKYLNYKCKNLSSGQKQRIAIARCLGQQNKIIFADEPTGNLDKKNAQAIFQLFKDLAKEMLIIVVTHNTKFALQYGDYHITLNNGMVEECDLLPEAKAELRQEKNLLYNNLPIRTRFLLTKVFLHKRLILCLTSLFFIVFFVAVCIFGTFTKSDYLTLISRNAKYKEECIVQVRNSAIKLNRDILSESNDNVFYSFKNADLLLNCELGDSQYLDASFLQFEEILTEINVIECDNATKVGGKLLAGKNVEYYNEIIVNETFAYYYTVVGNYNGKVIHSYNDIIGCKINDFIIKGVLSANFNLFDNKALKLTRAQFMKLAESDQEKYKSYKEMLYNTISVNSYLVKEGYSEYSSSYEYSLNQNLKNNKEDIFDCINFSSKTNINDIFNSFIKDCRLEYGEVTERQPFEISTAFANGIQSSSEFFERFGQVINIVTLCCIFIMLVFVFFFVYLLISKSKKEFSTLFEIGLNKSVIVKHIILTFILLTALILIIGICSYQLVLFIFNKILATISMCLFDLLFFEWRVVLLMLTMVLIVAVFSSLLITDKILQTKD